MLGTARLGRRVVPAAFLFGALAFGAALAGAATADTGFEKVGSLYRVEWGTGAYGFDATWRAESLWERSGSGWTRVANPDPARLAAFRRLLLHRVGARSLGSIAAEGQSALESLRSLGYI